MLREQPNKNPQTAAPGIGPGSDLYRGAPHESGNLQASTFPVDMYEDAEEITVEAELPGFAKEEIEAAIQDNVLRIGAQREATGNRRSPRLQERQTIAYQRRFVLPSPVDEDRIEARLENGVLTLRMKKAQERQPRRIEVL